MYSCRACSSGSVQNLSATSRALSPPRSRISATVLEMCSRAVVEERISRDGWSGNCAAYDLTTLPPKEFP